MAVDSSIGAGVSIRDFTDTPADTDIYEVTLNDGEIYDFWVVPNGGGNPFDNPALELAQGVTVVATNDDSAEDTGATFLFGATTGGDYTLTVSSTVADFGNYVLTVTNKSRVDDVGDHVFRIVSGADASVTGVGTNAVLAEEDTVASELIHRPGTIGDSDADVWAVLLTEGQLYSFTVEGATSGVSNGTTNADLRLLDNDGNDNGLIPVTNGSDETLTGAVGAGQGGWYFLEVTGATGSYRLSFDDAASVTPFDFDVPNGITGPFPANGAGDELDNTQAGNDLFGNALATLDNPFNLPLGDSISGNIANAGDLDFYAINLVAGFQYRFVADAGFNAVTLSLYNAGGAQVAAVSGAEPQTLDFAALTSGLYYVAVDGVAAGDFGNFTLTSSLLSTSPAVAHDITGLGNTQYVGSDQTDSITGGTDGDFLYGAGGNDTLTGGQGGDTISGGDGEGGGGGDDSILGDEGQDALFGDDGNDTARGGADNDFIDGGSGNDTIEGGIGNDTLDGDTGNDSLDGGAGDDRFFIQGANDTVIAGAGIDLVNTQFTYTLGADAENLTMFGAAVGNGIGNAGNNLILGNTNNNILLGLGGNDGIAGLAGNDTIVGGVGRDSLGGFGGNDRFDYNALNELTVAVAGRDVINQFEHADKVNLSGIDARTNIAGNQAFAFVNNFTGVSGQVQADLVAANTWRITGDVNGDAVADFAIDVTTVGGFGNFAANDFIL